MRSLAKLFFLLSSLFLLVFLYITINTRSQSNKIFEIEQDLEKIVGQLEADVITRNDKNLKYILQWNSPATVPFVYMGVGQQGFIERKCEYTNCFVTSDRNFLGDVTKFDVIAFAGPQISYMGIAGIKPKVRSPHQKYTFASIESAFNYPICTDSLNNFFNWTWTFRLDSESKWGYIIVRDANNEIIGPRTEMHWMKLEDMGPVSKELKNTLKNKTKAAAWFVSNCRTKNSREIFAKDLQKALDEYNLKIDIYGKCGPLYCPRDEEEECFQLIKKDYYFYLSFENSFSKDYVTEKLLHGLRYNAIPIVYGGANYTRFMPDGIYLNGVELGSKELAKKMKFLIDNPDEYEKYFKWTNHYSYYRRAENVETDDYCGFCKLLNDEDMVKKTSVYKNFKDWWNDPGKCP